MYSLDPEHGGGGGGGAANNLQPHQQEEEDGGGVQLVTPDPAADYLTSGQMAALCVLGVVLSSLGAVLLGLAFRIPRTVDGDAGAFVAELASGVIALGFGGACAAIVALRCCRGSHSLYG